MDRRAEIASIRATVQELGSRIGAPEAALFEGPRWDGSPYVEVDDGYHFVVAERGQELSRQSTEDRDELLYWVFEAITFSMASDFEVRNRKPGEDSRRQLFARQQALLGALSEQWQDRKAAEHLRIVRDHPFDDGRE